MKLNLFREIYDNQEYEKFIKDVEKLFRMSPEYKIWLSTVDRSVCAATGLSTNDGVHIEVHHYGRTLYDICKNVVDYFINNQLPLNSIYLTMVIFDLHMNKCVSYIPLLHCIHQMYHDDPINTINKYPLIKEGIKVGYNSDEIILEEYKYLLLNCFKNKSIFNEFNEKGN
jgi:hypothetical protein